MQIKGNIYYIRTAVHGRIRAGIERERKKKINIREGPLTDQQKQGVLHYG